VPHTLSTLAILMDQNVRDFQAFVRERDRLVRRGLMSDIEYRRRMAVDLVEELSIDTQRIRPIMQRLEEAAARMGALMRKLKDHRAGRGCANDPARIRQRLKKLMRMTLETPRSLTRRVRTTKARFREYERAKGALARDHSRLVVSVAQRYRDRGISIESLIQAGETGLMRAADKYQYQPGYRFSTCATWYIRRAIVSAITDQARAMADQARASCIPIPTPEKVQHDAERGSRSVDDPSVCDAVESPISAATREMLKQKIDQVLKTLTYREREIIKLRYGLADGYTYTFEEVGRIFKVSRDQVRQIEAKAMRRLQHPPPDPAG
jgi:RNA polymerase primary sigma factor